MKKVSNILKKLLVVIIIIMILNNFMLVSMAKNTVDDSTTTETNDTIGDEGQGFFLSFLGLLTLPARAIILGLGYAINTLTAAIAYIEGATDANVDTRTITPFDIFFNKVKILDVNFFEIGKTVNIVNTIRTGIAAWYYALRLIAISILLVILVYVGIRMAISTVATDKAMYKKMLYDWVVSLVLVFLINYIIIFVITLNNIVVDSLGKNVDATAIADTYDTIRNLGFKIFDIDSIPATVIYCMLVVQTIGLVITYFNRMLKIAFLIIISPLITLTYAVDKMGDGKAQALGNWLREFIFTVIIQIFHCIIYMSMINVAFNLLLEHSGKGVKHALATAVMAILCVNFVRTAEDLVRKILMHNHQDSSTSVAGGMAATAVALQKSKSLGTATRKSMNAARQNIRTAGNILKSTPKTMAKVATAPVRGAAALIGAAKVEKQRKSEEKSLGYSNLKKTDKVAYKAQKGLHKQAIREKQQIEKAQNKQEKLVKKAKKVNKKANKKPTKIRKATGRVKAAGKFVGKGVAKVGNAGIKVGRAGKRTISGISNFKHKLDNVAAGSDVYQFIKRAGQTYTAATMGAFTGSMMYGATGDASKAAMMAVAGYNMHRGFQQSAKTMESRTQSNLIGAGARTKEEAAMLLDQVASNPYLYDGKSPESLKQAEILLKAIGDQLGKTIGNPEYKTRIRNELDRAAVANPERMPQAIQEALGGIDSSLLGNKELVSACNDYATFTNMKQIYKQMENGQAMNISKDEYVQDCIQRFVPISGEVKVETIQSKDESEEITHEESIIKSDESGVTEEQIYDKINELLAKRNELEKQLEQQQAETARENLEKQLRELKAQESVLVSKISAEEQTALNESQREILETVRRQCAEEIRSLIKDLDISDASTGEQANIYKKSVKLFGKNLDEIPEGENLKSTIIEAQSIRKSLEDIKLNVSKK